MWQVHKSGGTSVANANCLRQVAQIIWSFIPNTATDDADSSTNCQLGIAILTMGGTPKTTTLLLNAVVAAAERRNDTVETILQQFQLKLVSRNYFQTVIVGNDWYQSL
jgi:aspartokinase